MKKIDWLYAGISLLMLFVLAAIPKMQFKYDIWVYFPVYFLLTLLIINHRKRPPLAATIAVVAGFLVPDLLVRFLEGFRDSYISIPRMIFQVLGCLLAYVVFVSSRNVRFIVVAAALIIAGIYVCYIQPFWFNYSDYGSFTGKVERQRITDWHVCNEKNDTINAARYLNKIVVFDFWNTGCAVCFKKFPLLQTLYDKYKSNARVIIQAVNIPLSRDTSSMAFNLINDRGFSFPVVIGLDSMDSLFEVEVYPTTFVIVNNEIVYRGSIEGVDKSIQSFLKEIPQYE